MTENPTQSGLSKIQNLPSSHISKPSWKGVGIDTAQMKSRHFSLTLLLMAQLTPFLDSSLVVSRWLPLVLPGPIQQKRAFVPAFPAKVLSFTLIGPAEVMCLSQSQSQWEEDCAVLMDLPALSPLLCWGWSCEV